MSLQVIGALCIVAVLAGQGLTVGGAQLPRLSRRRSAAVIAVGVVFIALGLLAEKM